MSPLLSAAVHLAVLMASSLVLTSTTSLPLPPSLPYQPTNLSHLMPSTPALNALRLASESLFNFHCCASLLLLLPLFVSISYFLHSKTASSTLLPLPVFVPISTSLPNSRHCSSFLLFLLLFVPISHFSS